MAATPRETAQELRVSRRTGVGRVEVDLPRPLDLPSEIYSFSGNPFGIWSVFPAVVGAFALLAIALAINLPLRPTLGAFLLVTLGLLLIPAVTLRGKLTLNVEDFVFEQGKKRITGPWDTIVGLHYDRSAGICLKIEGATQEPHRFKAPGGLIARDGNAQIPLRLFGDRRFGMLYLVRDRLSKAVWRTPLQSAKAPSRRSVLMVYLLTTAICTVAVAGVAFAYGLLAF